MLRALIALIIIGFEVNSNAQNPTLKIKFEEAVYHTSEDETLSIKNNSEISEISYRSDKLSINFDYLTPTTLNVSIEEYYEITRYKLSCKPTDTPEFEAFFGFVNARVVGPYQIYSDAKRMIEEGSTIDFKRHGPVNYFNDKRELRYQNTYNNGVAVGLQKRFGYKGVLIEEKYLNNQSEMIWEKRFQNNTLVYYKKLLPKVRYWYYDDFGKLKYIASEDSARVGYFENGNVRYRFLQNDEENWEAKLFYESGHLREYEVYSDYNYKNQIGDKICYDKLGNIETCEIDLTVEATEIDQDAEMDLLVRIEELDPTFNYSNVFELDTSAIVEIIRSSLTKKELKKLDVEYLKIELTSDRGNLEWETSSEIRPKLADKLESRFSNLFRQASQSNFIKKQFSIKVEL